MYRLLKVFILVGILFIQGLSVFSQSTTDQLTKKGKDLYDKGLYKEAEKIYLSIPNIKEGSTLKNPEYHNALNGLANIYRKKGNYKEALAYFTATLDLRKKQFGSRSLEYAETLNDIAILSFTESKFNEAEKLLTEALKVRKEKLGTNHSDYAETLDWLGYAFLMTNNFDEASEALSEAHRILTENSYKKKAQYGESLKHMSHYYAYVGKPVLADVYGKKTINYYATEYGEKHPEYAYVLGTIAYIANTKGEYKKGIQSLEEALLIFGNYYGKTHPDYVGILCNLGMAYQGLKDYDKAIPLLEETLSKTKAVLGKEHTYYISAGNALAIIYQNTARYSEAETLLLESLELRKKMYNNTGPYVLNGLNSLSVLYMLLNNHALVEKYLLEALDIASKDKPLEKSMINIYCQLGGLYEKKRFLDKSFEYYQNALELQKKTLGTNHPNYYSILNLYANARNLIIDPKEDVLTEKIYIELLETKEQMYGKNSQSYIFTLDALASFYTLRKQLDKALKMYEESLDIINNIFEKDHPDYANIIGNIAYTYDYAGNYKNAEKYYKEAFELKKNEVKRNFNYLSETERELYWQGQYLPVEGYKIFAHKYIDKNPSLSILAYDAELFVKSLLLNSSINIQKIATEHKDENLKGMWKELFSMKSALLDLDGIITDVEKHILDEYSLPITPDYLRVLGHVIMESDNEELKEVYKDVLKWKQDYINLENNAQQYEKYVINEIKDILPGITDFSVQWTDIRDILKQEEVAIEFITLEEIIPGESEPEPMKYYALLIRADSKYPEMVYLCEESELQIAIRESQYDSQKVYPLVWKPLEKYLNGIKDIYLAPTGLLNSISFSGMKTNKGYLYDDHIIHNMLSTKDIIKSKDSKAESITNKTALLIGGADYEISGKELAQINKEMKSSFQLNLTRGILDGFDSDRGQGFNYLPGFKKEVQIISQKLKNLNWQTSLLIDTDATETHLKNILSTSSPELLHISTHGFYFSSRKDKINNSEKAYYLSENPLMRTGLAFTGANYTWNGNKIEGNADDGILTAYEVSCMNLFNTKLVVLSACDTGLGDVSGSEGVYGLQRAFRSAGAKYMLLTLWKVSDVETVELMNDFYTNWMEGMTLKMALHKAQGKMKLKYPDDPEKWAGFVLIE